MIPATPKKGHSNEEDIFEFQDTPQAIQQHVTKLANLIRQSKHLVAYTGAGISTSASIPDYRGPEVRSLCQPECIGDHNSVGRRYYSR
jgi:hypothetical protein